MHHMSCRPVLQVPLTTISQTELRNQFVLKILSNIFFFFFRLFVTVTASMFHDFMKCHKKDLISKVLLSYKDEMQYKQ